MTRGRFGIALFAATAVLSTGMACAPHAAALPGTFAAPTRIPAARLAPGAQQVVFRWEYRDPDMFATGEGAARVAAPDSVRIDLFLDRGMGSGYAIVIGDSAWSPGGEQLHRFLPPVSMLWAALGRLAVPAGDTTVRVDGATTGSDIARGTTVMRVAFAGERLSTIEHIEGGAIRERVARPAGTPETIQYEQFAAHRSLTLTVTRRQFAAGFDAKIWQR
jgi:hypothetical protein